MTIPTDRKARAASGVAPGHMVITDSPDSAYHA